MKCPHCDYENREAASFCQDCGAQLTGQSQSTPAGSQQPVNPPTRPNTRHLSPATPQRDTRPLQAASVAFAPLPEGALLQEGRYIIMEVRGTNEQLNVYIVEDTSSVRVCPNCHTQTSVPDKRFCSSCGADLSDTEPVHRRYLARESADPHAFAVETQLLKMGLEHPGLLLPHAFFAEAPYGPARRYLIIPEFPPAVATSLPVPQELTDVLEWGISLAHALDYLHRYQVTLQSAGLEHITVEGERARWTNLGVAQVIPASTQSQAPDTFAQDVQTLARALFYLATGQNQYTASAPLPERAMTLFSQALTTPAKLTAAAFANSLEAALGELRRPSSVTPVVGRRTDVGQERSLNEDSLLALDLTPVFRSVSAPVGLFIVADGMGGHEAGDVASELTVRTVTESAVKEVLASAAAGDPLPDVKEWLTAATQAANRAVYEQRQAAGTDMGTTLVMALLLGDTATIANVGDSRAYLLKQESIVQITTDHSLVERLIATEQITREEAEDHPQKNVIYRVIGDKPRLEIDLFKQRLDPGEALLLCSDGLSGMVSDETIWQTWRTSTFPQEACDRLVEAANLAGGEDNISVVLVQVSR